MSNFTNLPATIEIYRNIKNSPWSYFHLDQRQRQIAEDIRNGKAGALLISELEPVITLGRRTPQDDILLGEPALNEMGIGVYRTDRGGLATYHGPGQWVLFPVERLETLTGDRKGVRQAVGTLLEIAYCVGRNYDKKVEIRSGSQLGVWTQKGKFASVGVHIEQGVLFHGLSVNGFKTPLSFQGLRPCGLDAQMDYLLESPSEDEFQGLQQALISETLRRFWGRKITHPTQEALTATADAIITH